MIVLILNAASYFVVQMIGLMETGVEIVNVRERKGEKAIYLIGGCQCRTLRPFEFMLDGLPEDAAVYLVEYRNAGFDVDKATDDLLTHIWAAGHTEVTFVAVSMGYRLAMECESDESRVIALNPCPGGNALRSEIRRAAVILPIARAGLVLLGWAAMLPVVKINGEPYYSLQLLFDQFKVAATECDFEAQPFRPDVLVLSREDGVIDNDSLLDALANEPEIYWIDTVHFGFVDNGPLYREAVVKNLS